MSQDKSTANGNEVHVGRNKITHDIMEKMGICPYFGTNEILDEALIQKEQYGGKRIPSNTVLLSTAANVYYGKFLKEKGVISDMPFEYYQNFYNEFLASPKEEFIEEHRIHLALKHLVMLRTAFMDERKAMEARVRNKGKVLDLYYPIDKSASIKKLEKLRKKNEPLLEDLKPGEYSWENVIGDATALMGFVQRTMIENDLQKIVEKYPIWQKFGKFIPGFGIGTCAMLIAKLDDPRRFEFSDRVRAFAGVAPKDGKPMRRTRGESCSYNPRLKDLLLKVFPDSFMKASARCPDEPYSQFFQSCRIKQAGKAEKAIAEEIVVDFAKKGVEITEVQNLGYEEREGKKVFKGFLLTKKEWGKNPPFKSRACNATGNA